MTLNLIHARKKFFASVVVSVEFGSPTYTIPENGGSAAVCLTTSMGSDQPLTVSVSTAPKDISATGEYRIAEDHVCDTPDNYVNLFYSFICAAGEDFVGTPQQVTIPASAGPSEVCFNIPIIDDSISERDEEFQVSFRLPSDSGAQIGPLNYTCVSIIDDDSKYYLYIYSMYKLS